MYLIVFLQALRQPLEGKSQYTGSPTYLSQCGPNRTRVLITECSSSTWTECGLSFDGMEGTAAAWHPHGIVGNGMMLIQPVAERNISSIEISMQCTQNTSTVTFFRCSGTTDPNMCQWTMVMSTAVHISLSTRCLLAMPSFLTMPVFVNAPPFNKPLFLSFSPTLNAVSHLAVP